MRVQIYGDSIMKGVLVDEKFHYKPIANTLLAQLQQETGLETINRAHFGYTSGKGQIVLQRDLTMGLDCQAALLEFGGNDCNHNWSQVAQSPDAEHLPNTPLQTFLDTLRSMVHALRSAGIQPLLMTLPPLDAQRYLDFIGRLGSDTSAILHWLGDLQMIYRWQELYSSAIVRLADQLSVPLVDIRSIFLSRRDYSSLIGRDGIHLTETGYHLVFRTLQDTLLSLV